MTPQPTPGAEINRTQINRANAQHSTGPKTDAGKKKSSLNALRHGLTGQIVVMPAEDLQAYQSHLESFTDEYDPQGATEANLVQALADTSWRLNRVAALEANLFTLAAARYPNPLEDAPSQIQDAMAIAAALESQAKGLTNLSIHSQRLSRQFERTAAQLREIQETRHAREQKELKDLLDIMEMHESKGERTAPPPMASFFQTPKSTPRCVPETAIAWPKTPTTTASDPPPSVASWNPDSNGGDDVATESYYKHGPRRTA